MGIGDPQGSRDRPAKHVACSSCDRIEGNGEARVLTLPVQLPSILGNTTSQVMTTGKFWSAPGRNAPISIFFCKEVCPSCICYPGRKDWMEAEVYDHAPGTTGLCLCPFRRFWPDIAGASRVA